MAKTFGGMLFVIVGLLAASAANASPLTFYYDQASWLAAASGLQLGAYSAGSTETVHLDTIEYLPGGGIAVLGASTKTIVTPHGGFSSISADFSYPTLCSPGCTVTRPQEIVITFDSPIMGFDATAETDYEFPITLNGQKINPSISPFSYSGFFGVIGQISSIDFDSCHCHTDSPENFNFSHIEVLTVSEPPAIACLLGGIFLLLIASRLSSIGQGFDTRASGDSA